MIVQHQVDAVIDRITLASADRGARRGAAPRPGPLLLGYPGPPCST